MDEWVREKLRCYRLKQGKRAGALANFLRQQGVAEVQAWEMARSGKGLWRKAHTPQAHQAMDLRWRKEQGLQSMVSRYLELQPDRNRRMR